MPYDRDVCIINLAYKNRLEKKYKVNAAIVSVHETKYASRLTKIKEKKTERTDYLVVIREIVTGRSAAAPQLDHQTTRFLLRSSQIQTMKTMTNGDTLIEKGAAELHRLYYNDAKSILCL